MRAQRRDSLAERPPAPLLGRDERDAPEQRGGHGDGLFRSRIRALKRRRGVPELAPQTLGERRGGSRRRGRRSLDRGGCAVRAACRRHPRRAHRDDPVHKTHERVQVFVPHALEHAGQPGPRRARLPRFVPRCGEQDDVRYGRQSSRGGVAHLTLVHKVHQDIRAQQRVQSSRRRRGPRHRLDVSAARPLLDRHRRRAKRRPQLTPRGFWEGRRGGCGAVTTRRQRRRDPLHRRPQRIRGGCPVHKTHVSV